MAVKPKKSSMNVDLSGLTQQLNAQFSGLSGHPSTWPAIPRYVLLVVVTLAVVAALWFFWLSSLGDDLNTAREQEDQLKAQYTEKIQKAASLEALKQQKEQVGKYVNSLEKQLPSKSEMDQLLSDINQAGLGRNLQFNLFKPGAVVLRDYYAELPIALKVSGHYHDIGEFAADVAGLSRIVTLNNISITADDAKHPDQLNLDATARTFRYLDSAEVSAQRGTAKAGKK